MRDTVSIALIGGRAGRDLNAATAAQGLATRMVRFESARAFVRSTVEPPQVVIACIRSEGSPPALAEAGGAALDALTLLGWMAERGWVDTVKILLCAEAHALVGTAYEHGADVAIPTPTTPQSWEELVDLMAHELHRRGSNARRPRALVASDNAQSATNIGERLEREGWQPTLATGFEASQHLQTKLFQLVVTDIFMDRVDGIEIISLATTLQPDARIVAVENGTFGSQDMGRVACMVGAHHSVRSSELDRLPSLLTPDADSNPLPSLPRTP